MSKVLMISPEKCLGCRSCELICSFHREGAFNPKQAALSVLTFEEAAISVPVMCMQCEEAACSKVCPSEALSKNASGTVVVDENKCIGCKFCISACPFGNVNYHPVERKIIKCDLCGGDSNCAKVCPTGAIEFKEANVANLRKKKAVADKFKEVFGEASV
ncbi:4Fe-4S dicluster domain-containing protein [Heliobacillus mobilis]|uniref:4Fe-4S dicluster domain-containing protein n=1 Tax=Heliobacterium mobile TaxID=28064 RepID=Q0PID9_HELMO|nr:4Fe-4S dicluster domain-containing protein [Heliobacterium mobile]ABH04878.1 Fe-S cluster-containing protein [Heliobacterium mobile]MTV48409.1 4Fe-4S dicluster domain-containing protein [Heliobacterium mobile]